MAIYDDIKAALIKHGWTIDTTATECADGEVREFIHPKTNRRLAYIDAIYAQMDLEVEAAAQQPDPRPGFYYVSAIDNRDRSYRIAGPWLTHQEALDQVEPVRRYAAELSPQSVWYKWGTSRLETAEPSRLGVGVQT